MGFTEPPFSTARRMVPLNMSILPFVTLSTTPGLHASACLFLAEKITVPVASPATHSTMVVLDPSGCFLFSTSVASRILTTRFRFDKPGRKESTVTISRESDIVRVSRARRAVARAFVAAQEGAARKVVFSEMAKSRNRN